MYPAGNLFIPVAHGQLEAILKEPRNGVTNGVALVLHPHPLGGGTMHNKVVFRAAEAFQEAGFATLRFNFRGVGGSPGVHDDGRGEGEDARAAIDFLSAQYPAAPLALSGFSFGGGVCLADGPDDARVRLMWAVAPGNRFMRRPWAALTISVASFSSVADWATPPINMSHLSSAPRIFSPIFSLTIFTARN